LDARAVGRGESPAASVAGCRPGDCCARGRQGGPRGGGTIRMADQCRFAVHYGLNSDIAAISRHPKPSTYPDMTVEVTQRKKPPEGGSRALVKFD
jgi:hypothetical protein